MLTLGEPTPRRSSFARSCNTGNDHQSKISFTSLCGDVASLEFLGKYSHEYEQQPTEAVRVRVRDTAYLFIYLFVYTFIYLFIYFIIQVVFQVQKENTTIVQN